MIHGMDPQERRRFSMVSSQQPTAKKDTLLGETKLLHEELGRQWYDPGKVDK